MYLFLAEIRKLVAKRSFLITFLLLFLLSIGFLYLEQKNSDHVLVRYASAYSEVQKKLHPLSLEEKAAVIQKADDFFTQTADYERQQIDIFSSEQEKISDPDFLAAYQRFRSSAQYQKLSEYTAIAAYLREYYERLLSYDDYLKQVQENITYLLHDPLQPTLSDTRERELSLTAQAYERLQDTKLQDESFLYWEQYATSSLPLTTLCLWLFLSLSVAHSDDSSHMLGLLSSTPKGRRSLRLRKCLCLLVLGSIAACLLEIAYCLVLTCLYGKGALSLPLQSIPFFYTSSFSGTILKWFLLSAALKLLIVNTHIDNS